MPRRLDGKPLNPKLKHRRREFLEFLATTRFESVEELTSEWWAKNATTMHQNIELSCSVCRHTASPKFHDFFGMGTQRGIAPCACSGTARWGTESGRIALLQKLKDAELEPLGFLLSAQAYADAKVVSQTYLPIRCLK